MSKLFVRVPSKIGTKGTIYRLFNATNEELGIIEPRDGANKFTLSPHLSLTKYWEGNRIEPTHWMTQNGGEGEKITLAPASLDEEFLGVLWLPKDQYRPGDTIRGFVFLRRRPVLGQIQLELCSHDQSHPFVVELLDHEENTLKVVPITEPENPVLLFELETSKYNEVGPYKLVLRRGKNEIATQSLKIDHYEKPDIQAVISGPKWVLAGDNLSLAVDASYFHGEPVEVGEVVLNCEGWDEPLNKPLTHGSASIDVPDLTIGSWTISASVKDETGREAKAAHQVIVADEPYQLELEVTPPNQPLVENQPVTIMLHISDPVGSPVPNVKFRCSLKSSGEEEMLGDTSFSSDESGLVRIAVGRLEADQYAFVAQTLESEVVIKVKEMVQVRRSTTEDLWITIEGMPPETSPSSTVEGVVAIAGKGLSLNKLGIVYLDTITDAIVDSQELTYDLGPGEVRIPFQVKIPHNYFGEVAFEAYLSPVIGSHFSEKKEDVPKGFEGKGVSFPKSSTKARVKTIVQEPMISFRAEVPTEVATGTSFEVKTILSGANTSDEDLWLSVALTDERVLAGFQPVKPKKVFYKPCSAIDVITIGSIPIPRPRPTMVMARAPGRGRAKGGLGIGDRLRKTASRAKPRMALENELAFQDEMTMLGGERPRLDELDDLEGVAEESLTTHVVRTEFPEDVVIPPQQIGSDETLTTITAPDSITTYRLFFILCTKNSFGVLEKQLLVRNPVFTATQNPPQMILGDELAIPTVIENLSSKTLRKLVIKAEPNECLQVSEGLVQELGQLKGRDRMTVLWPVKAIKVGDAQFATLLTSDLFTEYSELQKPLYISPPGAPHPTYYRSVLEAGQTWEQTLEVTGEEAFVLGVVNFMPGLDLAVLEGVESLATYPYGCCEQTSATTIPNAVAYQYLESRGKLTDEVRNTLLTNMRAGRDRYMDQFRNPENGGFGLWNGDQPSVFHTSLAISVIGKIKGFVDVPEEVFTKARSYLASNQGADGSYDPQSGVHKVFPATLSKEAMTAFVVHSQAVGGVLDEKGLNWLLTSDNYDRISEDPTVLALVTDVVGMLRALLPGETLARMTELVKALVKLSDEGESGTHWAKGSSLSSEVETTSYALVALAHSEVLTSDVIELFQSGSNYLLNTRTSSGWFTTRDTLWACLALGEIAKKLKQGGMDGALEVSLNGKVVTKVNVTPENRYYKIYDLRNIFLDQFQKGSNSVSLKLNGSGAGHVVLELRKWFAEKERTIAPVEVKTTVPDQATTKSPVILDISVTSEEPVEAVMLEQPIPSGFEVPEKTLDELRLVTGVDHVEVNSNKLAMFFTTLSTAQFKVGLVPTLAGKVQVDGIHIMPMYQPEQTTTGKTHWITVTNVQS